MDFIIALAAGVIAGSAGSVLWPRRASCETQAALDALTQKVMQRPAAGQFKSQNNFWKRACGFLEKC